MKMRTFQWVIGIVLMGLTLGWGQLYDPRVQPCRCPTLGQQSPFSNDYAATGVENGVIAAVLGWGGTAQWATRCFPLTTDPCTTRPAAASIVLGTWLRGSSLFPGLQDSYYALNSGFPYPAYPGGAYITLRVDGQNQLWGDTGADFQKIWAGESGIYVRELWERGDIHTDMRIELVQSVFRIRLKVTNASTSASHTVGMRFASDVEAGIETGPPYVYVPGRRPITVDSDLRGLDVPNAIEFYNARSDLVAASRYLLAPAPGFEDATRVDQLVLGEWFFIMATEQWFDRDMLFEDSPFEDTAMNLYYNERPLGPGQEREYVVYVSLVPVTSDVARPMAVGVETWSVLDYNPGGLNSLGNNPFIVYCNITDQYFEVGREVDLRDVQAVISLPPGLRLAKAGDPDPENPPDGVLSEDEVAIKKIPVIRPDQTSTVQWVVVATGEISGPVPITVSVSADPAPTKTIIRTITISATNARKYEKGFQLISMPFRAAGTLADVLGLSEGSFLARRWVPEFERYVPVDIVQPGEGFWLYLPNQPPNNGIIALSDVTPLGGQFNQSFTVTLSKGWNQIGNPYLYPILLGQVTVVSAQNPERSVTLAEAVGRGDLRGVIYFWDEFTGEYKFTSDLNTLVLPHRGYWLKSNVSLQFTFPPVLLPGSGSSGGPRSRAVTTEPISKTNWRLQLVARTPSGNDTQNYIGIAPDAADGIDNLDVEEPPPPESGVSLSLRPIPNNPVNYMQDVRAPAGSRWEFQFVVRGNPDEEVRLQWPNLKRLPKEYTFRLIDLESNRSIDPRRTAEYRYRATTSERTFTLEVKRQANSVPLITNVTVSRAGRGIQSVSINYSLAADAVTQVRILGSNGKPLATPAIGRAATRGLNSVSWNLRDHQGRSVPAGSYVVEITATGTNGERARAVRPVVVTR